MSQDLRSKYVRKIEVREKLEKWTKRNYPDLLEYLSECVRDAGLSYTHMYGGINSGVINLVDGAIVILYGDYSSISYDISFFGHVIKHKDLENTLIGLKIDDITVQKIRFLADALKNNPLFTIEIQMK